MWETDSISALTRSAIRNGDRAGDDRAQVLVDGADVGAIDMPLSFNTMMMSRPEWPAFVHRLVGSPQ